MSLAAPAARARRASSTCIDNPRAVSFNVPSSAFAENVQTYAEKFNHRPRSQSVVERTRDLVTQARVGTWQQVHQLLSLGASVYQRESHLQSDFALKVSACLPGRAVITRLLAEHGLAEQMPLATKAELNKEALAVAADRESTLALVHGGFADVNGRCSADGSTALMAQAAAGRAEVCALLIMLGARTDVRNDAGKTAADLASNDATKHALANTCDTRGPYGVVSILVQDGKKDPSLAQGAFSIDTPVVVCKIGDAEQRSTAAENREAPTWNQTLADLPIRDAWVLEVSIASHPNEVKEVDIMDLVCHQAHSRDLALSFKEGAHGYIRLKLSFRFL